MQRISNDRFPNLPRLAQISNTYCGPATLAMLFANKGIRINQEEVVAAANLTEKKINRFGTTVWELAAATKNLTDLKFWIKDNAIKEEISELVLNYHSPVGVEWQGEFLQYSDDDYGHYSVVTDVKKEESTIYLADPYKYFSGKDRRLSLDRFEELWWDTNEIRNPETGKYEFVKDYHLLFILAEGFDTFPHELGMTLL